MTKSLALIAAVMISSAAIPTANLATINVKHQVLHRNCQINCVTTKNVGTDITHTRWP